MRRTAPKCALIAAATPERSRCDSPRPSSRPGSGKPTTTSRPIARSSSLCVQPKADRVSDEPALIRIRRGSVPQPLQLEADQAILCRHKQKPNEVLRSASCPGSPPISLIRSTAAMCARRPSSSSRDMTRTSSRSSKCIFSSVHFLLSSPCGARGLVQVLLRGCAPLPRAMKMGLVRLLVATSACLWCREPVPQFDVEAPRHPKLSLRARRAESFDQAASPKHRPDPSDLAKGAWRCRR